MIDLLEKDCNSLTSKSINSVNSQAHPSMTEQERKKLCRVMDCQRLSLEACLHAAQNERLPLRVVVQVIPNFLAQLIFQFLTL